jgi:hypothetical protein
MILGPSSQSRGLILPLPPRTPQVNGVSSGQLTPPCFPTVLVLIAFTSNLIDDAPSPDDFGPIYNSMHTQTLGTARRALGVSRPGGQPSTLEASRSSTFRQHGYQL